MNFEEKLDILHNLPRSQANSSKIGRFWLASLKTTPPLLDAWEWQTRRIVQIHLAQLGRSPEQIQGDILPYIVAFMERWKTVYIPDITVTISLDTVKLAMLAAQNNKLGQIVVSDIFAGLQSLPEK